MVQCVEQLSLGLLHGKAVGSGLDGGEISSDGGAMLVRAADQHLGLTATLAGCPYDVRGQTMIWHSRGDLLGQRVCQIACGHENCDDAADRRHDWALKTALGRRPNSDCLTKPVAEVVWWVLSLPGGIGVACLAVWR